ncbi:MULTISPECIES: hypothetical protein [unclassified Streptomyces]|uniref:hypothetical protein n=1 Tax=unclassified Streptomyces TaxID=2593676 RepID=UPI00379858E5
MPSGKTRSPGRPKAVEISVRAPRPAAAVAAGAAPRVGLLGRCAGVLDALR